MNFIDLLVLAMLGIGFLIGYYKGFVNTVANAASFVVAYLFALIFHGSLAGAILDSTSFGDSLLYYTAGAEKLSDMTIANVDVATLSVDLSLIHIGRCRRLNRCRSRWSPYH